MSWGCVPATTIHIERGDPGHGRRVAVTRLDRPFPPGGVVSYKVPSDRLLRLEECCASMKGSEKEAELAELAKDLSEALECQPHRLLDDLGQYVSIVTDIPHLPWECLCLDPAAPVERALGLVRPVGRILKVPGRGKCLEAIHTKARTLFVANPEVPSAYGWLQNLPEAEKQAERIYEMLLADSLVDPSFRPHDRQPILTGAGATLRRIAEVLRSSDGRPVDILHLSCHCEADAGLILTDGAFRPSDIHNAFGSTVNRFPRMIFIDACGTDRAIGEGSGMTSLRLTESLTYAFISAGANCVIGTSWPVAVEPSAELAIEFYRHAILGRSVGRSLQLARQRVRERYPELISWAAFVMYGDPELRLFAKSEQSQRSRARDYLQGQGAMALAVARSVIPKGLLRSQDPKSTLLGPYHGPIHEGADCVVVLFRGAEEARDAALRIHAAPPGDASYGVVLHRRSVWSGNHLNGQDYDRLLSEAEQFWQAAPPGKIWASYGFYDALRRATDDKAGPLHWRRQDPVSLRGLGSIVPYEWSEGDEQAGLPTGLKSTVVFSPGENLTEPTYLSVVPWDLGPNEWRFCLHRSELRIGRAGNNDLVLLDREGWPCDDGRRRSRIGRKHARLLRCEDGWYVEDQGSGWGTFVGEMLVGDHKRPGGRRRLSSGEDLHFGDYAQGPRYRLHLVQPHDETMTAHTDAQVLLASMSLRLEPSRQDEASTPGESDAPSTSSCAEVTPEIIAEKLGGPTAPMSLLGHALAHALEWTTARAGAIVGCIGQLDSQCALVIAGETRDQVRATHFSAELLAEQLQRHHRNGKAWSVVPAPVELSDHAAEAYAAHAIVSGDQWLGAVVLALPFAGIDAKVRTCMSLLATALADRPIWQ